jgi:hypothetical protein
MPIPEPVAVIAGRMGKPAEEVEPLLKQMTDHYVIRVFPTGDSVNYAAMPFAPGILELSVRNVDADYARDYQMYLKEGLGEALAEAGRTNDSR